MADGVVIVGAGHAGVQAAASLREEGYQGPVTLVGDEAELPYHKPPLSKAFLKDADTGPQMLRSEAFYTGADIALRLGERVERIDPASRRLDFASGAHVGFDRLILATGSRPRVPALPGHQSKGVFALRSLADARALREAAQHVEDVVVIGGGFIGLEIAATLSRGGRRVTVVEAQDRLLGRAVAPAISAHVQARLTASGVRVMTRTLPARIQEADGRAAAVVTADGERIPARMVVIGIGVVPNSELAEAAGLAVGNGIRVDAAMRSSVPDILAIGDVASYRHWLSGTQMRLESVQNATDQARHAARTVLGRDEDYQSVPWFWSDIGDMKLQMVGLAHEGDRTIVTGEPAENRFSVFHYAGPRLIAIESVNRPADHMLGRKMIAAGFSPDAGEVAGGDLKPIFAAWQAGAQGA